MTLHSVHQVAQALSVVLEFLCDRGEQQAEVLHTIVSPSNNRDDSLAICKDLLKPLRHFGDLVPAFLLSGNVFSCFEILLYARFDAAPQLDGWIEERFRGLRRRARLCAAEHA